MRPDLARAARRAEGPWWRASTDFTEPVKVSPSEEEEQEVFDEDEDEGVLLGATNALAARLKAVEERRERELDEEAAASRRGRRCVARRRGARRIGALPRRRRLD